MIKIITDSSSNISQEEAKEWGITVIPLTIIFGDREYADGTELTTDRFYEMLSEEKEFPHTAQLGPEQIEKACKDALNEADEVLLMPIAASLSGSYERAVEVASKFKNVYVFETSCTTVMLKMLVMEALKYRDKTVAELEKILVGYRPKIKLYAALDTLEYLGKGGRLSRTSAIIGTMLKIKPVISFGLDGNVELVSKQFGINKAINFIAQTVDVSKIDFTKPVFYVYTKSDTHGSQLFSKLGIEYTYKNNICPVIGTHAGPDAAGIVYAEK